MKSSLFRLSHRHSSLAVAMVALLASHSARAATFTWDIDPGTAGVQEGNATWIPATSNFLSGGLNGTPVKGTDSLVFGVVSGTSGLATIDNGGALLRYSDAASNSSLTINGNYNFAPTAAGDGLAVGNITINNGSTVGFTAALTGGVFDPTIKGGMPVAPLTVPVRVWELKSGSTLNLSGGGRIQNLRAGADGMTSTVNILAGSYLTAGGNASGGDGFLNFGSTTGGTRILNVNQSAGTTVGQTNIGNFNINSNGADSAATKTTYNLNGGTLLGGNLSTGGTGSNAAGARSLGVLNLNSGSATFNGEIRAGNDGGSGVINVKGGTLTGGTMNIARNANTNGPITGEVNIGGGVTTITGAGIQFGRTGQAYSAGTTGTLSISSGSLYVNGTIGSTVDNPANHTAVVNLSGGTLGAHGNLSSALAMTLTNTTTLKAANEADAARNITLSGSLTGTGGINKTGGGSLIISGATTTYGGGTILAAGTLATAATGSFGTGDITMTGPGTLTLGNNLSFDDLATLMFTTGSLVQLNFSGTETLGALRNSITSESFAPGLYNVTALNNEFGGNIFSGSGSFLVTIPEPSSAALAALGMLAVLRRRR